MKEKTTKSSANSSSTSASSWERIPSDYDVVSSSCSPGSTAQCDDVVERGFEHSGYEFYEEQQELPHAPLLDHHCGGGGDEEENVTDVVQAQGNISKKRKNSSITEFSNEVSIPLV